MQMYTFYEIRNTVTDECYIGSTTRWGKQTSGELGRRWQHLNALRRGAHENSRLQEAFTMYGESAFTFTILGELLCSAKVANAHEEELMQGRRVYNLARYLSDGTKLSDPTTNLKTSSKQLGELNHRYGKPGTRLGAVVSSATRALMSAAQRGKWAGEKNPKTKLSADDREKILELRAAGMSQQSIADKFGVSQTTVSALLRGKTWSSGVYSP